MKTYPIFIILPFVAIFTACTSNPNRSAIADARLTETQVLTIAKGAVAKNDSWVDRAEFEAPQRDAGHSDWTVVVWRMPKTPGGFRLIRIDDAGRIVSYDRGR